VRSALKAAFPATRFSVKSKTYAGGASITVSWNDGPTIHAVDPVVRAFSGAGFDGMIDLKYYVSSWLLPDGTVQHAHSPGTEGSRGCDPAYDHAKPHPDAKLVHFGADYIFTQRDLSPAFVEACKGAYFKLSSDEQCALLNKYEVRRYLRDFNSIESEIGRAIACITPSAGV
jgi:hypothetical protein